MADRTTRDDNRDSARAELERIRFLQEGQALEPWQTAVLPLLVEVGQPLRPRAFLDFIVASAIEAEVRKLTAATERLVASSDNNTDRMERVAKQLNTITTTATVAAWGAAIAAIVSLVAAWRAQPALPPEVHVHPAITLTAPALPPAVPQSPVPKHQQ